MNNAWLKIALDGESVFCPCSVTRTGDFVTVDSDSKHGKYALRYDGKRLTVQRSDSPAYEMSFEEGLPSSAEIATPYGNAKLCYTTTKLSYREDTDTGEWTVEYEFDDRKKIPLVVTYRQRHSGGLDR